jgi:hypothetical protein
MKRFKGICPADIYDENNEYYSSRDEYYDDNKRFILKIVDDICYLYCAQSIGFDMTDRGISNFMGSSLIQKILRHEHNEII